MKTIIFFIAVTFATTTPKSPASDDMEKIELLDMIDFAKSRKNVCPGFNTPGKCVFSETEECMNDYYDKEYEKTKEVCNEVPIARDCLIKLNNTCTDDVILYDIEELDNITALCNAGHYGDGPCSASKVRNCTLDLFSDFKDFDDEEDGDDFEFAYQCNTEIVVGAKRCLAGLRKTCKSPAMQNEIEFEWDYVNDACPPS